MMRPLIRCSLLAAVLVSCGSEPTATVTPPALGGAQGARAPGGGGARTTYAYAMSGDLHSLSVTGTAEAPTQSMPSGKPFANLSLSGVQLAVGPSLSSTGCGTMSSVTASTWDGNGGSFAGTWTAGSVTIPRTLAFNFLASRPSGEGVAQMQLTAQVLDGGAIQSPPDANGVITLTYENAALFSDTRATYHDGKYRCVSFTLTATPVVE